nr:MAG TPA: hypothetical protein [Caudoviricetes sp.]
MVCGVHRHHQAREACGALPDYSGIFQITADYERFAGLAGVCIKTDDYALFCINEGVLFMTVSMDMTALEKTMAQIKAATDLPEDNPYVVAAAMSCSDATYDRMMVGPAQMTEAQCCVAAWCRLFRCDTRPVDGRDVAFAMSAFSIPVIDSALYAIDSFSPMCEDTEPAYQVLRACVGLAPKRATEAELAADRMRRKCAELLNIDVVPER